MHFRSITRQVLPLAALAWVVFGAVAVADQPVSLKTFKLALRIEQDLKSGKPLQIYVSYHDVSNEFAPQIKSGVAAAAKADMLNAHFVGPVGADANQQISQIEDLMPHMDGLAISSVSTDALAPVINRIIAAGIPVVTFNTDNPKSNRLAFAGQDLVASGHAAGDLMAKALDDKGPILITTIDAAAQWSLDREKGAKEALAQDPKIKVVQTVNTGTDPQQIYAAIENAMLAHPQVKGILSLECCSTPGAGTWVQRNGMIGKVKVVGFDLLPATVDLVQAGAVVATIDQAPERQGYDAVDLLSHFLHGDTIQSIDTGVKVYMKSNIETLPAPAH
jgi:simple sugar transport system substrate-binding protein